MQWYCHSDTDQHDGPSYGNANSNQHCRSSDRNPDADQHDCCSHWYVDFNRYANAYVDIEYDNGFLSKQ